MIRITELALPLDYPPDALRKAVSKRLQVRDEDLLEVQLFKRSYDARKKNAIKFVCIVDVSVRDEAAVLKRFARDPQVKPAPDTSYHPVARAPAELKDRPIVIGFGPGGLFAALLLAQMGFRPIVLERGRDVRRRTQDTWALWRKRVLTPESNVQFGEGGAGLFSDGKLYSQIKDPKFYGRKVMREFVKAGAPEELAQGQMNPANWDDYAEKLAVLFLTKTQAEWCELLEGSDACFAPVLGIEEAREHPHMKARGAYVEHDGIWHTAPAPRFSRTPGAVRSSAEDGAEVVARWGAA